MKSDPKAMRASRNRTPGTIRAIWLEKAFVVSLLASVVACCAPGPWQKPDASPTEVSVDLASCQQAAKADADRMYVFSFPFPYPLGWNGGRQVGYTEWQQRFEAMKSYEESRLADACMRDKGYRISS
jgi:hypothetical protein